MPDRSRPELKAVGRAHFYLAELQADIEFTAKPNGGMNAKITQPGAVNSSDGVVSVAPVKPDLNADAGVYWSDELEAEYTILARDRTLFGSNSHHGEFELTPTTKDKFRSAKFFFQDVTFVRNHGGRGTRDGHRVRAETDALTVLDPHVCSFLREEGGSLIIPSGLRGQSSM
jgi:hypothetical protein